MRFSRRLASTALTAALAVSVFAAAAVGPQARAQAAPDVTQPCTPDLAAYHGMLPQPPLIKITPNQTITIDVLQGPTPPPNSSAQQSYCYVQEGDTHPFVDAPTIQVRQGETFTMILKDRIPPPSPSASAMPSMAPEPQMTAADGCALLPYEPPLPAPSDVGYLGHPRVYATMPAMIPNDTNFHTHGWHVSPEVDNVFKSLARSEGNACSYTFAVPLTQPAGTYWYHAHVHGLAGQQVGGGLAGTLIVLAALATPATPLPDRVILIKNSTYAVDKGPQNRDVQAELAFEHQGALRSALAAPTPPPIFHPFDPPSWPSGWPFESTAQRCCAPPPPGSFMSHWVVNGVPVADPEVRARPIVATLQPGERQRYRIVNGMSDSYANIAMYDGKGSPEDLDVINRDGVPVGVAQQVEDLFVPYKNVLLPPGGRVDIIVTGMPGTQALVAEHVCTGYLGEYIPVRRLLLINSSTFLSGARVNAVPMRAAQPAETAADALYHLAPAGITKRRAITFTQYADLVDPADPGKGTKNQAWYITDTSDKPERFMEHPFWLRPDPINAEKYLPEIDVPQNSVEEWSLINASGEIHAFHIHQLTFVTMSNPEFEGPHLPVFQDTVALPPATIDPTKPDNGAYPYLAPSKTVIRMDFRHVDKGTFVFHCHMLFHEDRGMMAIVRVY